MESFPAGGESPHVHHQQQSTSGPHSAGATTTRRAGAPGCAAAAGPAGAAGAGAGTSSRAGQQGGKKGARRRAQLLMWRACRGSRRSAAGPAARASQRQRVSSPGCLLPLPLPAQAFYTTTSRRPLPSSGPRRVIKREQEIIERPRGPRQETAGEN